MKKQTQILLVVASTLLGSTGVFASQYPAEAYQQKVSVVRQQAALFAKVQSLTVGADIIGYSKSGYLSQPNINQISAIIKSSCTVNGEQHAKTSVVVLKPEWHQAGFMSGPLHTTDYVADACKYTNDPATANLEIAFSDDKGNWDSNSNKNYIFASTLNNDPNRSFLDTQKSGNQVVQEAWDFIISKLR